MGNYLFYIFRENNNASNASLLPELYLSHALSNQKYHTHRR